MTARRSPRRHASTGGAFRAAQLERRLHELVVPLRGARLCVAFSGGADSTALLAALVRLRPRCGFALRALHVDHRLQAASGRWAAAATAVAARLDVPLQVLTVQVATAGRSVEAAARAARYAALAGALAAGEVLVTAHHEEDQLETVLLQLMRGAGLAGLSAMPARARFGPGWLLRPLLGEARAALRDWVRAEGLEWVEDPSNSDTRYDRNYLRAEILPRLLARWPAAARSAGRSTRHLAEAQALLRQASDAWLERAQDGAAVRVTVLRAAPPSRQRALLRRWLERQGVAAPDTLQLELARRAMLETRGDTHPVARWRGGELRRHGDRILYARSDAQHSAPPQDGMVWRWRAQPGVDVPGSGRLSIEPHAAGALALDRLPSPLRIRFRTGGEGLASAAGHKPLKNLLQELDIAPWLRSRLPLLWHRGRLLAVADLWLHPALRANARTRRRAHLRFQAAN